MTTAAAPAAQPATSAERCRLAVMFCDVVGSTALSAPLDPEDVSEIMGAYCQRRAEQIAKADPTNLARLWRSQGKRTEARDLHTPTCGWFTEAFDTSAVEEAKSPMNELAS